MALRLPDGYNPRTVALARQWRREAGGDDAAIVDRALRLDPPRFRLHAGDAVARAAIRSTNSCSTQKAGFCEHFSSAFVVLMRAAGIPARVVTGYVGGYRNPIGDYWLVRRSDAHAWAEVWLQGRGWVRVDPTAAVAPERIYDTLDDRAARACFGDSASRRCSTWATGCGAAGTTSCSASTPRASNGCCSRSASTSSTAAA